MANQCYLVKQDHSSDARINSMTEKLVCTFIPVVVVPSGFVRQLSIFTMSVGRMTQTFYGEQRVYKRGCISVRSSHIFTEFWSSWTAPTNVQISWNRPTLK